jgi:hypothetical protein
VSGLRKLGPSDYGKALAFAARHPDRCTYIAGWIEDGGLDGHPQTPRAWLVGHGASTIEGLVYVSDTGIVIPAIDSESAIEEVAHFGQESSIVRVIVGEREVVDRLWRHLEKRGYVARIVRDQLAYAVTRATFREPPSMLPLEVGTLDHLEQIVSASAAMALEEARDDPRGRNPELFRTRIRDRLARHRDFIHMKNGRLAFKSNVSAVSAVGGQVEGIYTLPPHRKNGLGFAGTASVTSWVLERSSRAFLLVNDDNLPARRIYERLGYTEVLESRTIFVA